MPRRERARPARPTSPPRFGRGPAAPRSASAPRRGGGSPSVLDPPRLGVDVHPAGAHKTAERYRPIAGQVDGEARGRSDGDEDWTPGHRRLLHELERESPADAQHRLPEWQEPGQKGPADYLVHRVVPADVLAPATELAAGVEEARRVEAAGGREAALFGAQAIREALEKVRAQTKAAVHARRLDGDGLESAFAADAAR